MLLYYLIPMYNLYEENILNSSNPSNPSDKLTLLFEFGNFSEGVNKIIDLQCENPEKIYHLIKHDESHPNCTISSMKGNFVYDFERVPDDHIGVFEKVSMTNKYKYIQIFINPEKESISKLKYFADTIPSSKFKLISIETKGIWGETRRFIADLLFNSDSKLALWCNRFELKIPYDDINVQLQYPLYLYYEKGLDERYSPGYFTEQYEEEIKYYNIKFREYLKNFNKTS